MSSGRHASEAIGGELGPASRRSNGPAEIEAVRSLLRFPQCDFRVFLFFLAFVVARYIQIGARRDILATVRFEFLLGLLVVGLAVWQMGSRKPELGRAAHILFLILALFIAMLVQLPFAAAPVLARTIFVDRVVKFAILTFLMVVMVGSPRYLRFFLLAFLFSVFYITLESIRGLITGGLVWQNQGIMRLHGAVPIYEHPNSLGGVAMGTLPFVVFLFSHFRRWWQKVWLLAIAGSSLVCVVYSGSRTAYIGLLGFVLWWWWQSKRKWKFCIFAVVFGALLVSVLPPEYIERFQSISGEEKEGHSKEARIIILKDAWVIFVENPLGVGVASFPAVRVIRFGRYQDTHNLYLEVGTNLGIQGLVVFILLLGAYFRTYHRATVVYNMQRRKIRSLKWDLAGRPRLAKLLAEHDRNLELLVATARATGGFIFIRVILGFFGMDLYEVYWWFGGGIALILSGMELRTKKITDLLLREIKQTEFVG